MAASPNPSGWAAVQPAGRSPSPESAARPSLPPAQTAHACRRPECRRAPPLSGRVTDRPIGPSLTLVWVVVQVRETPPTTRARSRRVLPVIAGLLRSRDFMGGTLVVTAVTALFFIVISVLPVMFRALTPGQVGLMVSGLSVAFTLGAARSQDWSV